MKNLKQIITNLIIIIIIIFLKFKCVNFNKILIFLNQKLNY